jgi:hypothetical protein
MQNKDKLLSIMDMAKFASTQYPSDITTYIEDIRLIEKELMVTFSDDFIQAFCIYNYCLFDSFSFISFPKGVIIKTLEMRECGLPNNVLVLFEEYESIMLMKCLGTHEEIYWLAIEDFERFCNGEKLEYEYDFFPSFAEFFKSLLEETKRRDEEYAEATSTVE